MLLIEKWTCVRIKKIWKERTEKNSKYVHFCATNKAYNEKKVKDELLPPGAKQKIKEGGSIGWLEIAQTERKELVSEWL